MESLARRRPRPPNWASKNQNSFQATIRTLVPISWAAGHIFDCLEACTSLIAIATLGLRPTVLHCAACYPQCHAKNPAGWNPAGLNNIRSSLKLWAGRATAIASRITNRNQFNPGDITAERIAFVLLIIYPPRASTWFGIIIAASVLFFSGPFLLTVLGGRPVQSASATHKPTAPDPDSYTLRTLGSAHDR